MLFYWIHYRGNSVQGTRLLLYAGNTAVLTGHILYDTVKVCYSDLVTKCDQRPWAHT